MLCRPMAARLSGEEAFWSTQIKGFVLLEASLLEKVAMLLLCVLCCCSETWLQQAPSKQVSNRPTHLERSD